MKKLLILLFLFVAVLPAKDFTGGELLDNAIDVMNPEASRATLIQTIRTTSGETRTLKYRSFTAGEGEMTLMRYLEPARVRGNAMMMKNFADDIWMYNRRTRRVRKLASHAKRQNFEGSDFTYEDMGTGESWKEDYIPNNKGTANINDVECYQLECLPADNADVAYSKMVVWLRSSDFYPVQVDYYEDGELLKKLIMEDIENIEGHPTATKMVMKNVQQNTQTIMEYEKITYDVDYDPIFFSERRLRR
ncbi:MAG TPA: outer membrane lipoprotein-sorting protein [bacterium]|nr:outer membrane lipoprotein-sorting protein [bacterium]